MRIFSTKYVLCTLGSRKIWQKLLNIVHGKRKGTLKDINMRCKNCGFSNNIEHSENCNKCGMKLNNVELTKFGETITPQNSISTTTGTIDKSLNINLDKTIIISDNIDQLTEPIKFRSTIERYNKPLSPAIILSGRTIGGENSSDFQSSSVLNVPSNVKSTNEYINEIDKNTISISETELYNIINHNAEVINKYIVPFYFFLENGSKYDGYSILNPIGEGSYSKVYEVKNELVKKNYVFKILKLYSFPQNERELIYNQFLFEYNVGQIESDYLIKNFKRGFINGNPYIVLEYANGGDLKSLISTPISLDIINKIGLDILRGLRELHNLNIIHRDIKPSNIFLSGQVFKIGDFGTSVLLDEDNFINSRRKYDNVNIVGTHGYLAPELFDSGVSNVISFANDIFSFGCLMFEVITGGHLPFGQLQEEFDIQFYIYNSKKGVHRAIRNYRKDIPTYWEDIILKCLQSNPSDRFDSIENILKELQSNISNEVTNENNNYILNKYEYDIFFSFSELDKLLAIEIFSFLENRGLKIFMINQLFDIEDKSKNNEILAYQRSKYFLALYTRNYEKNERLVLNLKAFIEGEKNINNQQVVIYNAIMNYNVDEKFTDKCIVVNSKEEILNSTGNKKFDRVLNKEDNNSQSKKERNETKGKILELSSQNCIKEGINLFLTYLKKNNNIKDDAYHRLILLLSRLKGIENDEIHGTANYENIKIEKNKIILSLNLLVEDYF